MESRNYDVVVVGGGVSGAVAALKLSRAGKNILLLEAGIQDPEKPVNYDQFLHNFYTMGLGRSAPNAPYPVNPSALSPGDSANDPYFIQKGPQNFLSDYLRMLGGTTLHWQGTSVRMLPHDFQMQTTYGRALDWPISYDDLEPYYREAEGEIGVCANVEEQRNHGVWFPHGYVFPMQRMSQSLGDQFLMSRLGDATIGLYGGQYPLRVVSMPVARNANPNPLYNGGKAYNPAGAAGFEATGERCQGNSSCTPLCPVQAKYNALKTLVAATKTGRLTVQTRCVASKLQIDPVSGRITGVEYKRYEAPGGPAVATEVAAGTIVVLAANAIENAVLLLASGITDQSGQVGRNLMDHPYINLFALAPVPVYPFRGPDTTSGVESLRDGKFREKHAAFRGGMGNWGWNGDPANSVKDLLARGWFGRDFRRLLHDKLTRMFKIGTMIEQLPNPENRVTIDPTATDFLGNQRPVLTYTYDDYTLDAALAIIGVFWPKVLELSGMQDKTDFRAALTGTQMVTHRGQTFSLAGSGHLVGTHRMGNSPAVSVTDANLRVWAHTNLYVVGAGSMVTIGTSNPTLTAAALSMRAADHIIKELH